MAFPTATRILICTRPDDPQLVPRPGMIEAACEDCGSPILMGLESQRSRALHATPAVCLQCYARWRDAGHPTFPVRQRRLYPES